MEQWQALIEDYPSPPDLRYFGKILHTAEVVLKEDLAPFEIEWITETLLFKPVDLLHTISSKRNDDAWSKSVGDSFKLLADVIPNYAENFEPHYEDIVDLCLKSYDAQTRKQAILCLTAVAKRHPSGAKDAKRHIEALGEVSTCKAPLALLVGTICENHPEVVADEVTKIWRIYLNMLESNKNTDTLSSSVLQGLFGLFYHFGSELPTAELNVFYDKMTGVFMQLSKCEDICLRIIADHCHLFRERIAKDARTRGHLWRALHDARAPAARAVRAAYTQTCAVMASDTQRLCQIFNAEIEPQTRSHRTQVKYCALRIQADIEVHGVGTRSDSSAHHAGTHALLFELREGVSYDTAEAISWCIEANLPNSDKLLQTAILFYSNLPASKRKEIVVHGILNASQGLRTASLNFLINETCQDLTTLERYQSLWTDLFDTDKGRDTVVLDKSRSVFEDFMGYTVMVLENFLEEEKIETFPDRLTTLLSLTTTVLTLHPPEDYTEDLCTVLLSLLVDVMRECGGTAAVVSTVRAALRHVQNVEDGVWKNVRIDRCRDEALLCESCLALMEAPSGTEASSVLTALQVIFSRNDVEPKILSKALQKLEWLMGQDQEKLDENCLCDIIHHVEKLHNRKDLIGKDARVLHRDILMFLGKYGNKTDSNNNLNIAENTLIVKLKDLLVLNLPNPHEGTTYKLNLQRILQLALVHEEPNVLQTLLVIICANLSTRKDATLQYALTLVVRALSRAHSRGAAVDARALQAAVVMCDSTACVQGMLAYICEEKSPGVRKMLSAALEALVVRDPGSDLTESLVLALAEHTAVMMGSHHSTTKRAGLDITETLITALKENNTLTKKLLPNIVILISKTNESDSETAFELASKLFLEKIELFEDEVIENVIRELLKIITQNGGVGKDKMADETELKAYKMTVKFTLNFVKKVYDYEKEDTSKMLTVFFDIFENENGDFVRSLYALAEIRHVFDLAQDLCRNVLSYKDFLLLNELFCIEIVIEDRNQFRMESVLKFFEEYSEILLELQYENTLDFLSKIIRNLTPKCIKYQQRNIKSCLSVYKNDLKNIPHKLLISFENWCKQLPIKDVTRSVEKDLFTSEHALIVNALKIMLNIFDLSDPSVLTDISIHVQNWPRILLKLYSTGYITNYLRSKVAYLTDLLSVSVRFLKLTDVKRLILEGHSLHGVANEKVGIQFCSFFMSVFFEILIRKPFILMDGDMGMCSVLLNDIVKYALKRKCTDVQYEHILELVDEIWPTCDTLSSNQKHPLLLDLANLPKKLGPESKLMQWVISIICSDASSRNVKARLIGVLPGGEAYGSTYRTFASALPIRLSELRGDALTSLRALLDALAATGDSQLLDIVMTLASGDDTNGWWYEAIDSCMASIALNSDTDVCKGVYTRCWDGLSTGVCDRVLVPLLRYSTSQFCERFYSTIIKELLQVIRKGQTAPSLSYAYRKSLVDYVRAMNLLTVAFEKIPPSSLESPSSILYRETPTQQSWHLIRVTCKCVATLRDNIKMPDGADDALKRTYRLFHCANYKCLCAAICRLRPDARVYSSVIFNPRAWAAVVNCDVTYTLKLRSQWNQRTKRQPTSVEVSPGSSVTSLTMTSSPRTRLFLRTLSENPLQYDLIADAGAEETTVNQELHLQDNELNKHECAATLTAVLCHASALPHTQWRDALTAALVGDLHSNVKWLLAQAICNCKEELKPHASALRPALLALISTTACIENEKKLLNGLHVDILETLVHWQDESPCPSQHLDSAIDHLIATCLVNRPRVSVYNTLLHTLGKLLDVYGAVVNVSWGVFEPYIQDTSSEGNKTVQILSRVAKCKVYIRELLPVLLTKLEARQWDKLSTLAELFGLALAACQDSTASFISRFKKILETARSNGSDYVRLLYYAQAGHAACCDHSHFKVITDITPKIPGPDKSKCLSILTTYITHHPQDEYIQDMFDTIDICELVSTHPVEALGVAAAGVGGMKEGVRRRVVSRAAGCCEHSLGKVRSAACGLMLKAFEDLFPTKESGPSAKRAKMAVTPILNALQSNDIYTNTVLKCVACGLIDRVDEISQLARDGVAKRLCTDNISVRFAECFLLAVYLPSTTGKQVDVSVCLSALLAMLFSDLRGQERFKRLKLRDEPLVTRESISGSSKLLTMSRTYQGTFRRPMLTARRTNIQQEPNTPDIDIQIPVDDILETLLQFSKDTPDAAQTLCVELFKTLLSSEGRGSDSRASVAEQLSAMVATAGELSPLVLQLCRVLMNGHCWTSDVGFQASVQKLKTLTIGTESEFYTKLLCEDIKLRCMDHEQFVLGVYGNLYGEDDVKMEELLPFTIEDLTSVFGKLSNWDDLTVQQKRRVLNSGLPPLWADEVTFQACLTDYEVKDGWFNRMVSAYRKEDKQNVMRWLGEVDRWPRKRFAISAVTEAIEWLHQQEDRQSRFSCDIQPTDCLAEWAARLMIRKAYLNSFEKDESKATADVMLSRSHELAWCARANEMQLSSLVLDCVKRNTSDLYESETLPWLRQKVLALRAMGLKRNDSHLLKKAMDDVETYTPQFWAKSAPSIVLDMEKLILQLHCDLKSLTKEKLQDIAEEVSLQIQRIDSERITQKEKQTLDSIYELAITYYDDLWDESGDHNDLLSHMTDVLSQVIDIGLSRPDAFVAVILNRLDNYDGKVLSETTARKLLSKIQNLRRSLDDFTIQQLTTLTPIFPSHLLNEYPVTSERDDCSLVKYKKCFQLLCDAEYLLLQYCDALWQALGRNDSKEWKDIYNRIKEKMFENAYAGSDYQLLTKYKNRLYEICDYDSTETFKDKAEQTLKDLRRELRQRKPQDVLRLSQLCPVLSKRDTDVSERDRCLAKLLGLTDGVTVVRFDEQISVFTDSIRRPAVLRALLSTGASRRYLHKSGEPLTLDAAAVRAVKMAASIWSNCNPVGYSVTPLSDDCGLIEFLEDHERLRSLISSSLDIDGVLDTVARPADHELILAPTHASIQQHQRLCDKVPPYALRSAVERNSACAQDFVVKQRRFLETLAAMTLVNWVLGLGDRHLQNILYSIQDGGVCCVDWGALFQYGVGELPPARLTRNMLAVCDTDVLESRLQSLLCALRDSHKMFLPVIKTSFKWMGAEFDDKFVYIKSILQGKATSYDITREAIDKSDKIKYKRKYTLLLDNVFRDSDAKDMYTVEEQVSCLLRHCTDPQILAVTRSGWEPWI